MVLLQQSGVERLSFAQASCRTVDGVIRAAWKRKGDSIYYEVTVPEGVTGTVMLPGKLAMVGAGHYKYRVRVAASQVVGMIPYPVAVSLIDGRFIIDRKTEMVREARGKLFEGEEQFLRNMLRGYWGAS